MRKILAGSSLIVLLGSLSVAQEKSVKPGINDTFKDPDLSKFVKTFEGESREVYSNREEIVKRIGLKPDQIVADVGAGTGLFTRLFAPVVGEKGKILAVDIAPKFLDHIRKTCKETGIRNVETIRCTADDVNLKEASVDLVFICDTYHHFEFPAKTMSSIRKALRSDGQLILIDFSREAGKSTEWIMNHVRAGQEAFVKEITDSGFKVVAEEKFLKENYFVRFQKK